ncbi:ribosomal protein L1p/L10e family-domain-containing protein [Diplogelasinospora grovesii]|uniref:Ribosomal protein L1p/L10e family-domain-containing protein n=1 Tax=Diplogelasinospora grovesii TaxID=303347 RepID=A0AAN6NGQ3_9PEZI|nr:ribosomal protein L1p/L10e family-domain-containing protein [Diplogelasinospora grovesii]
MSKSTSLAKASDAVVSPVDPDQTLKASKALLAHIKKAAAEPPASGKQNLLAQDEEANLAETPIWLTLTTKRHIHDSHRLQPGKIAPLPHPLNDDPESTICLITADPQRAYKNMVASEEFPEDLRNRITRVIDLSHLKAKFKQYEAQRKLFSEHDIFLADDRITNRLPKALGKTFYKTTIKRPVPVVLMVQRERVDGKRVAVPKGIKKLKRDPTENFNARPLPEIVKEIRKAAGAALVHLSPSTNTAVKVGYASWPAEHIAANVEKVVKDLVERFVPQKWKNVRNLYIKGPETAALPIWQTDELWLEENQVVPDGEEPPSALPGKRKQLEDKQKGEKPNIGKKRKSLDAVEQVEERKQIEEEEEKPERPTKKSKKEKKEKALPESNDDKLDKEIAMRKATLRKQKSAAKKAVDV